MSASIDERIVVMKFDNTQFEQGARQALSTLKDLENGLKLDGAVKGLSGASKGLDNLAAAGKKITMEGATKGLNDATKGMDNLSAASKRFSLAPVGDAVQAVSAKFSAMTVIGTAALGSLAAQSVVYGKQIAQGLFAPVREGFSDYELKISATQTIMAGTGESIGTVTKYLKELDTYADQTIYSLSDMVSNIGKFTNAGVDLKTATAAMKGISNVAAVSGASTQEAARAMYNLGQAIGSGVVKARDWISVDLANMGTKEFKEQLIQGAVATGTLKKGMDGIIKTSKGTVVNFKNFRETLEDGWLTSEALNKTLVTYADETTAIGKKAYAAAKDVKSFSMMVDTLKAAMGTGWTDTFDIIIGNLPEAKKMWTDLSNTLSDITQASATARNKMLGDWKALGGRTAMIEGVRNAFHALASVINPIRDALRQIFPPTTGKQLADMTKTVATFFKSLQIGSETADALRRTFAGVFAIFSIGWQIVKNVAKIFGDIFSALSGGNGPLLEATAGIGDIFVALDKAIKKGEGFNQFFQKLRQIIAVPLQAIQNLKAAFFGLFKGIDGNALPSFQAKFSPMGTLAKTISNAWSILAKQIGNVAKFGAEIPKIFDGLFKGISNNFGSMFRNLSFDSIVKVFQSGLLVVLVKAIYDFVKSLRKVADETAGVMESFKNSIETITKPFEALTGTLQSMQNTLRAATILQIAAAVALLSYSMVQISKIDEKGLKRALVAMAILFVELTAAMAVFQKINPLQGMTHVVLLALAINVLADAVRMLGSLDFGTMMKGLLGVGIALGVMIAAVRLMPDGKKMINASASLILMATAVKILASAVLDISGLSWEEMGRGLAGVGGMLLALGLWTKFAGTNAGGIAQGAGIILLATGIKILASALKDLSGMSWEDLARGLAAMGVSLALIGGALKLIPPSSVVSAAGVAVVALALGTIGKAVQQMSGMDWGAIAKGMVVMGGALAAIAIALSLMPPTSALSAAAIFVTATSLGMLSKALITMSAMGWESIAKGLVMLGGALAIIAVAMNSMSLALQGAAALVIVVGALTLFLPVLALMGQMAWGEIAKGLTVLAGAFAIIGVAGVLLTPVVPTLMGLGAAIALLGAGMALAGVGLLAFATGLTALAAAGTAGVAAIVAIVAGLIGLIPTVMTQIGLGIVAFAKVIATSAPAVMAAITSVLVALLTTIRRLTPQVISTLLVMLQGLLRALVNAVPMLVNAGMRLVIGILDGIGRNIRQLITKGTDVIVNFMKGISDAVPRLADQAAKTIIAFVNGVADAIRANSYALGQAGGNMATAIIEGMVKGIAGGISSVVTAAKNLAKNALDAAKNFLGINSPSKEFEKLGKFSVDGYVKGLDGDKASITAAAKNMTDLIKAAVATSAKDISSLQARLNTLNKARKKDTAEINKTKKALADARQEHAKALAAQKVAGTFGDEYKKLGQLADRQAAVAARLDAANKTLADAIKTRDDYNKQVRDQYDNLPTIGEDTKLPDFIDKMKKQVVDTQIFTAQLQELRKRGLNDAMYKELLSKGTDAIPFVEQILAGGQGSVTELNTLGTALDKSAKALADNASKALYQAAVDSAKGLVDGLKAQQAHIERQMDVIAASMIKAIKKALGIKSPSREFMKVGDWSVKGLAQGFSNSDAVISAAENVGNNAIDAMRKTLAGLGDIVDAEVQKANPVIKPVLDLSEVQRIATHIHPKLPTKFLQVEEAYSQARSASLALRGGSSDEVDTSVSAQSGDTYVFNQYNNSPKAISPVETYRNTRNLLSTAKGARKRR